MDIQIWDRGVLLKKGEKIKDENGKTIAEIKEVVFTDKGVLRIVINPIKPLKVTDLHLIIKDASHYSDEE
ncbi:hypothetical protein LCGC14_2192310 [marine sediment metagenome]|uniref:PRC-barrel domain-containing protein n=1 Tax=marine sediment metagenome TaxID=412755 RepID=A0A0F9FWK7_9ZZZZ